MPYMFPWLTISGTDLELLSSYRCQVKKPQFLMEGVHLSDMKLFIVSIILFILDIQIYKESWKFLEYLLWLKLSIY